MTAIILAAIILESSHFSHPKSQNPEVEVGEEIQFVFFPRIKRLFTGLEIKGVIRLLRVPGWTP